jgi:predicted ABC-type transport system involved in lysophospholipase L1 biosynthesis ATPase subunit
MTVLVASATVLATRCDRIVQPRDGALVDDTPVAHDHSPEDV